jgi:AcrR family transcriptional regulator
VSKRARRPEGSSWTREDRPDLAIEKILHAAEKAFVELGVSAAGMAEIADAAGCSRGTLYRYFPSRHELHVAYVKRTSLEIQRRLHEAVAPIADPRERLAAYILGALRAVRSNPATAAWFEPGASAIAARMSRSAEVAETLTAAFAPDLLGSPRPGAERLLRRRWIVRVIVSLLSDPAESEAEERMLIERFVAPAFGPEDSAPSRTRRA